jgi:hypothetical protein
MKPSLLFALLLLGTATALHALDTKSAWANSRTVIHADGTKTESVRYPEKHEQREVTYDTQGVKIASKLYLLNAEGQTLQGNVYDGRDQLQARAQFFYDSFGRLTEQRMFNLSGQPFQRIMFEYDMKGNQLTPKSYNLPNVEAPSLKPAVRDFTGMPAGPSGQGRPQGTEIPMLPTATGNVNGQSQPLAAPSDAKPAKGGFFSRLFKGKDKKPDEKK